MKILLPYAKKEIGCGCSSEGRSWKCCGWVGDLVHLRNPEDLLRVIVDVYRSAFDRWFVAVGMEENWMKETLHYIFQMDACRCKF